MERLRPILRFILFLGGGGNLVMITEKDLLDERCFSTNIQTHDPEVYVRPGMNQELDYIGSIRQNGSVKGSAS